MLYDRFQSTILFFNFIIQTGTDLDASLNNILSTFLLMTWTFLYRVNGACYTTIPHLYKCL